MGFRTQSYCTIWEVTPKSDTLTRCRVSISRKNKQTDTFEQDFGGYIEFVGTACAAKAAKLKEKDRIRLGDVDVTNRYDKTAGKEYVNFKVFSFEMADGQDSGEKAVQKKVEEVDDGEIDDSGDALPF